MATGKPSRNRYSFYYKRGSCKTSKQRELKAGFPAMWERAYKTTGEKQRCISEFYYGAKAWNCKRRIVTRLEFGAMGNNPRFVVTNLDMPAVKLYDDYDDLYCKRGEAENRIKETQLDLFGTRTSCHKFLSNWLRVLFAGLAYTLMQRYSSICAAPMNSE